MEVSTIILHPSVSLYLKLLLHTAIASSGGQEPPRAGVALTTMGNLSGQLVSQNSFR
jgi:hypothetical protein